MLFVSNGCDMGSHRGREDGQEAQASRGSSHTERLIKVSVQRAHRDPLRPWIFIINLVIFLSPLIFFPFGYEC